MSEKELKNSSENDGNDFVITEYKRLKSYAKGGKVRNMDEAYVRMKKGYVATIRKYEDLVNHPNIDDSPELIEIVNINEESSDKFKNQVTDFVSDIIVKTPPRYVKMFLNHAIRDVYIYCSHPNGVFGTYEMPNGREFDIFIPYITKGSRELNVEKYKPKSAYTKSMKKYIEENCTSMAKGGFIQEAVKEMKEKGTTGSFTKQAKNAGMTTTAFAKEVLKNPKKFTEKTRKRALFMKNTNPEKFNVGGEIVRAYDVNVNSGVGTYARGGKLMKEIDSVQVTPQGGYLVLVKQPKYNLPKAEAGYEYIIYFTNKNRTKYNFKGQGDSLAEGKKIFKSFVNQYDMPKKMARGGKMQGYNAQLDESLGMRKGAKRTKQQSDKDRRDEAKAMNKAMGRRAYASVRGMDKGRRMMAKGGKVNKKLISLEKRFNAQLRTLEILSNEKYLYNDKDKLYIKRLRSNIYTLAELGEQIEQERYGLDGVGIFATGGQTTMAGDTDYPSELLNYGKGGWHKDRKYISDEKHEKAGKKYKKAQGGNIMQDISPNAKYWRW